jgi:NitT/TauT family transport system permease protein
MYRRIKLKKFLSLLAYIVGLFLLVELSFLIINPPKYLLPSLNIIFESIVDNRLVISQNFLMTIFEIIIGFFIANALSLALSVLIFLNKRFEKSIISLAIVIKTIPLVAIAPFLILFFGSDIVSKVIAVVLICFFPSLINMIRGINSIPKEMQDIFSLYSATKKDTIKYLVLPFTLPYLFSSLKTSSSLAVIGALVIEFITVNSGIGFLIITGYYRLDIPFVYANIILISLSGVLFFYLIQIIEYKVINWINPTD